MYFNGESLVVIKDASIDASLVTTNDAPLVHIIISTKKHWGLAMGLSQIPMLFGLLFFHLYKFIFN